MRHASKAVATEHFFIIWLDLPLHYLRRFNKEKAVDRTHACFGTAAFEFQNFGESLKFIGVRQSSQGIAKNRQASFLLLVA